MATEHIKKGRALEQAVKFIQETVLNSSPEFKGTKFSVDTNVRDNSSGVLHEIDVLVKAHADTDYEAKWIFECKNWAQPIGKNEVIILAEKVEALRANKGFLVAKSITSEAHAQLEQKKRLTFIRCSEDFLSPLCHIEIVYIVTDLLPIVLQIKDRRRPPSSDLQVLDWKSLDCRLNGQPINFMAYIKPHVDEMIHEDNQKNQVKYKMTGTHWGEVAAQMSFAEGELTIRDMDVEHIMIPLRFFVESRRKKLISKFELEGRGRAYSFEPIEDFENGQQLEIHMVQMLS
jgi:hypothetical protein